MSEHFMLLLTFHFISLSLQSRSVLLSRQGHIALWHVVLGLPCLFMNDACVSTVTTRNLNKLFVLILGIQKLVLGPIMWEL